MRLLMGQSLDMGPVAEDTQLTGAVLRAIMQVKEGNREAQLLEIRLLPPEWLRLLDELTSHGALHLPPERKPADLMTCELNGVRVTQDVGP